MNFAAPLTHSNGFAVLADLEEVEGGDNRQIIAGEALAEKEPLIPDSDHSAAPFFGLSAGEESDHGMKGNTSDAISSSSQVAATTVSKKGTKGKMVITKEYNLRKGSFFSGCS